MLDTNDDGNSYTGDRRWDIPFQDRACPYCLAAAHQPCAEACPSGPITLDPDGMHVDPAVLAAYQASLEG